MSAKEFFLISMHSHYLRQGLLHSWKTKYSNKKLRLKNQNINPNDIANVNRRVYSCYLIHLCRKSVGKRNHDNVEFFSAYYIGKLQFIYRWQKVFEKLMNEFSLHNLR